MRALIQRVLRAKVTLASDGTLISQIGPGLVVLIGIHHSDTHHDADYVCKKLLNLRLWHNAKGQPWAESVQMQKKEILLLSQFTLYAQLQGNKPDFRAAMKTDEAEKFYNAFTQQVKKEYKSSSSNSSNTNVNEENQDRVKLGKFATHLHIDLCNDGPCTIEIDTEDKKSSFAELQKKEDHIAQRQAMHEANRNKQHEASAAAAKSTDAATTSHATATGAASPSTLSTQSNHVNATSHSASVSHAPNVAVPASVSSAKPVPAPRRKLRALLFDIDGTLTDSDRLHRLVFAELLKPMGVDVTHEYYNKNIAGKSNQLIGSELWPSMPYDEAQKLLRDKETAFRRLASDRLELLAGVRELLAWCEANGVHVAAVTNAPRVNALFMLKAIGLADNGIEEMPCRGPNGGFQLVIIGAECTHPKPHPEPYLRAMRELSAMHPSQDEIKPEECIVFEDSLSGAKAGVASGAHTVGVMTSQSEENLAAIGVHSFIKDYTQIKLDSSFHAIQDFVHSEAAPSDDSTAPTNGTPTTQSRVDQ